MILCNMFKQWNAAVQLYSTSAVFKSWHLTWHRCHFKLLEKGRFRLSRHHQFWIIKMCSQCGCGHGPYAELKNNLWSWLRLNRSTGKDKQLKQLIGVPLNSSNTLSHSVWSALNPGTKAERKADAGSTPWTRDPTCTMSTRQAFTP